MFFYKIVLVFMFVLASFSSLVMLIVLFIKNKYGISAKQTREFFDHYAFHGLTILIFSLSGSDNDFKHMGWLSLGWYLLYFTGMTVSWIILFAVFYFDTRNFINNLIDTFLSLMIAFLLISHARFAYRFSKLTNS
jgi:uncharacterized membrane protein